MWREVCRVSLRDRASTDVLFVACRSAASARSVHNCKLSSYVIAKGSHIRLVRLSSWSDFRVAKVRTYPDGHGGLATWIVRSSLLTACTKFCRERRARRQSETQNAQQVAVHSAGHISTGAALAPQHRQLAPQVGQILMICWCRSVTCARDPLCATKASFELAW